MSHARRLASLLQRTSAVLSAFRLVNACHKAGNRLPPLRDQVASSTTAWLVMAFAVLMAASVQAASLEGLKESGALGERPDGYVGVVVWSAAAQQVAEEVNDKRKRRYRQIAQSNGIALSDVERLAGAKAVQKTRPGHHIMRDGRWVRK